VDGIDVSNNNNVIDWPAVARKGVKFAILKATEGADIDDPFYTSNREAARKQGVKIGAYHFAFPTGGDAEAEALHFLRVSTPQSTDLRPALDIEKNPGKLKPAALADWIGTWLDVVKRHLGVKAIVYTYPDFWHTQVGNSTRFSDHPLWLASYGPNDGKQHSAQTVGGWAKINVHQFTSTGRCDGVTGNCDLNALNGSLDELLIKPPQHDGAAPAHYPNDSRFWLWLRWRLGEGEFKGHGNDPSVRPDIPERVPLSWWTGLKSFLAARNR
jgi:lysozyme